MNEWIMVPMNMEVWQSMRPILNTDALDNYIDTVEQLQEVMMSKDVYLGEVDVFGSEEEVQAQLVELNELKTFMKGLKRSILSVRKCQQK